MKIFELFEQTVAPTPPGQKIPPATTNNTATPTLGNQNPTGQQPGQTTTSAPPATPTTQTTTPPVNQQQSTAAQQQIKQATDQSKQTLTDLDKIAAQIVGLKQKQQQMQQQLQQTTV